MRRRDVLVGAAALAAIGLNPVAASAATRPRPGAVQGPALNFSDYPVVARVRAQRALEHLRVLSDQIGPRIAGTQGELRAKDYIAGVLRGLRYQVTVQPFAIADKFLGTVQVGRTPGRPARRRRGCRTSPARLSWSTSATAARYRPT